MSKFWAPVHRPEGSPPPRTLLLTGGLQGRTESPQLSFLELCFLSSRGIYPAPAQLYTPLTLALENCRDQPGEPPWASWEAHESEEAACWGPGSKSARRPERAHASHCSMGRETHDSQPVHRPGVHHAACWASWSSCFWGTQTPALRSRWPSSHMLPRAKLKCSRRTGFPG